MSGKSAHVSRTNPCDAPFRNATFDNVFWHYDRSSVLGVIRFMKLRTERPGPDFPSAFVAYFTKGAFSKDHYQTAPSKRETPSAILSSNSRASAFNTSSSSLNSSSRSAKSTPSLPLSITPT